MRNLLSLLLVLITVACGGKSGLDCNCPDCETCEECEPTQQLACEFANECTCSEGDTASCIDNICHCTPPEPPPCEETCECPYGFQAQCHSETDACRCIEEELECWDITRGELAHVVMKPLIDLNSFEPVGPTYPDVPESHQYFKAIHAAAEYGVLSGLPDGEFRPSGGVNKVEAAKAIVLAYNLPLDVEGPLVPDVALDSWYYQYVTTILGLDLVRSRRDGTYGSVEPATTCFADLGVAKAQLYNLEQRSDKVYLDESPALQDYTIEWTDQRVEVLQVEINALDTVDLQRLMVSFITVYPSPEAAVLIKAAHLVKYNDTLVSLDYGEEVPTDFASIFWVDFNQPDILMIPAGGSSTPKIEIELRDLQLTAPVELTVQLHGCSPGDIDPIVFTNQSGNVVPDQAGSRCMLVAHTVITITPAP